MYYISALLYYSLLIPISILPFRLTYLLSDGLSWLLFNAVGYRKEEVFTHLRASFPEKSEMEIQMIARKFYAHLCDLLVESVKFFTISTEETAKRLICRNPEVVDNFARQGKSIIIAAGHYNNFEMAAMGVEICIEHHAIGLYKPLHNLFFDNKIRQSRSRLGIGLVSKPQLKHFLENELKTQPRPVAFLFAMDQSPAEPKNAHWMTFLNQETGVQFGTEKYARMYDLPVVYGRIFKEKRGFYSFEFEVVSEKPKETKQGEILEKMTQMLEADIQRLPEYWLWSHRRWKHQNPFTNT